MNEAHVGEALVQAGAEAVVPEFREYRDVGPMVHDRFGDRLRAGPAAVTDVPRDQARHDAAGARAGDPGRRPASDDARLPELGDFGGAVAEPGEHRVGIDAEFGRRTVGADDVAVHLEARRRHADLTAVAGQGHFP